MAKNKQTNSFSLNGDYAQTQEAIRKAKGNPNKNIHHKKNGSNYQGYTAARNQELKAQRQPQRERQPLWVSVTMGGIFVLLIVVLVLMTGPLKDNAFFSQLASLLIGLACGGLFYLRRFSKQPESKFQTVLSWILAIMAAVYTFIGGYGLITML